MVTRMCYHGYKTVLPLSYKSVYPMVTRVCNPQLRDCVTMVTRLCYPWLQACVAHGYKNVYPWLQNYVPMFTRLCTHSYKSMFPIVTRLCYLWLQEYVTQGYKNEHGYSSINQLAQEWILTKHSFDWVIAMFSVKHVLEGRIKYTSWPHHQLISHRNDQESQEHIIWTNQRHFS